VVRTNSETGWDTRSPVRAGIKPDVFGHFCKPGRLLRVRRGWVRRYDWSLRQCGVGMALPTPHRGMIPFGGIFREDGRAGISYSAGVAECSICSQRGQVCAGGESRPPRFSEGFGVRSGLIGWRPLGWTNWDSGRDGGWAKDGVPSLALSEIRLCRRCPTLAHVCPRIALAPLVSECRPIFR